MELRIKISTLNNGEKSYGVQQANLKITGGWIKRPQIVWEDIYKDILTEEEAIRAAKDYLEYYEQKKLQEVKSVTYKKIQ
jgi:hypothetical protein